MEATSSDSAMAAAAAPANATFDIVATYQRLLREDPELTMPVAAIEALVQALSTADTSTTTETLALLSSYTSTLKSSIANPISLSAGCDLFQRYLMTSVRPGSDFDLTKKHLLSNGRLFVERAKASRDKIASFGRQLVRDGNTILTNGGSRVVGALLRSAAEASGNSSSVRFRVIYVTSNSGANDESASIVNSLRAHQVPVATIPESGVAYALGKVDTIIVGAEGVVENGGIISRLGTYQLGLLAKSTGKPFYVVAESHKFVRLYPLSQYDLPIEQKVIQFRVGKDAQVVEERDMVDGNARLLPLNRNKRADEGEKNNGGEEKKAWKAGPVEDAVDYTPPRYISGIITESGVLTPSAVSEELIKIWF